MAFASNTDAVVGIVLNFNGEWEFEGGRVLGMSGKMGGRTGNMGLFDVYGWMECPGMEVDSGWNGPIWM